MQCAGRETVNCFGRNRNDLSCRERFDRLVDNVTRVFGTFQVENNGCHTVLFVKMNLMDTNNVILTANEHDRRAKNRS